MSTVLPTASAAPRRPASHAFLPCALLAVVVAVLPLIVTSNYVTRVLALVWIMGFAAIGLHVVMGLAGQVSLGHAGFFGIGAYSSAILPTHLGVPPLLAVPAGVGISVLVAYLVGRPILRLKGHHLAIATLGFALIVGLVLANEGALTGGPDGTSVRRIRIGDTTLSRPIVWYWIGGALLVSGNLLAVCLRLSPTGRALRGILDSETAAASLGIDVARRKLQAFMIAAVYASIAGSALALMNGFITPDVASLMTSIEFVAMVVIGGSTTPIGAVTGAAILTVAPQLFASLHRYQDLLIGLVVMVAMIWLPGGVAPAVSRLFGRLRRGR